MEQESWFEKSFREDYVLVYQHRDEKAANEEINNLLARLPIKEQGRVLDLCCGSGRHSRALAKRGYDVVGVDLSPVLLHMANEQNTYSNAVFYQYDMREIPFTEEFDIVVNLFTSFGYFATDEENAKVIRNMANALKSGGEVVIDFLNPSYVKANLVPYSERETNGLMIEERRSIVDGYVQKEITVRDVEQQEPRTYLERVRLYEAPQMTSMLVEAGFEAIDLFGNYDFGPYQQELSPRMIFHAKKKKSTDK